MYDVAPGVLQRLREADIISRAGLAVASQGQDYCRAGAVHSTKRRGALLSGIVDLSNLAFQRGVTATNTAKALENYSLDHCRVSVEIRDAQTWHVHCTCPTMSDTPTTICAHAAALLYQWLAHPFTFAAPVDAISSPSLPESAFETSTFADMSYKPPHLSSPLHSSAAPHAPGSALSTADTLSQLALGDLRAMAREYDVAGNGSGKAELVEAILDKLRQPEAVRRVVGTLEKAQRQFLATLTLAGGQMTDEELRGLFERFSLGKPEKLQQMLITLQAKVLLLRTNLNLSFQLRSSLNSSLLDVNWFVPPEVRAALHIALPTTTFNIEDQDTYKIAYAEPFQLLPDLLLVARALDGYRMERDDRRNEYGKRNTGNLARAVNAQAGDGSTALPAPPGLPPASLLEYLQALIPLPRAFLRFAFLVLRLSDILYLENEANSASTSVLRLLPNAAELLLGMSRAEVLSELFTHWLHQSTYREIYDLQEEGLLLRCRATPMNQPVLRAGELEAENKAARQALLTLLAQAPAQQWIDFTAFTRLVYRLNPGFLQRRQRAFPTPHWWIEQEEGRPLQPAQWNDWQRAEGRYLAQLLQGPLRWWGICDLAFKEDGRLQAFRLTPMIELLLKGEAVEDQFMVSTSTVPLNTEPASDTLINTAISDANFVNSAPAYIDVSEQDELLLPSSFENWPVIQLVERFAQARGVRDGQLCYVLTPASLGEAFQRGETFAPLLELLRRAGEQEEMEVDRRASLARLLRQLEQRLANYGRVRLYTDATMLEVADGLVMRELVLTTSIEKQIIQHIHPTLMIIRKQGGEQLVEELRKRGQAPLLHEEG